MTHDNDPIPPSEEVASYCVGVLSGALHRTRRDHTDTTGETPVELPVLMLETIRNVLVWQTNELRRLTNRPAFIEPPILLDDTLH